jgi:hypothetical protein
MEEAEAHNGCSAMIKKSVTNLARHLKDTLMFGIGYRANKWSSDKLRHSRLQKVT